MVGHQNFLGVKFPCVDGLSAYGASVCLMSQGWSPAFHLSSYEETIHASLKHMAWHRSLCSVSLGGRYQGYEAVTDFLVSSIGVGQKLWEDYPDSVPFIQKGEPDTIVEDTLETGRLHEYRSGTRNVRFPERMTPVYALPGWSGCPTDIQDFMEGNRDTPFFLEGALLFLAAMKKRHPMVRLSINLTAFPGLVEGHLMEWHWGYQVFITGWGARENRKRQTLEMSDLFKVGHIERALGATEFLGAIDGCHGAVERALAALEKDETHNEILVSI